VRPAPPLFFFDARAAWTGRPSPVERASVCRGTPPCVSFRLCGWRLAPNKARGMSPGAGRWPAGVAVAVEQIQATPVGEIIDP
jgi:hypothetical protein